MKYNDIIKTIEDIEKSCWLEATSRTGNGTWHNQELNDNNEKWTHYEIKYLLTFGNGFPRESNITYPTRPVWRLWVKNIHSSNIFYVGKILVRCKMLTVKAL